MGSVPIDLPFGPDADRGPDVVNPRTRLTYIYFDNFANKGDGIPSPAGKLLARDYKKENMNLFPHL